MDDSIRVVIADDDLVQAEALSVLVRRLRPSWSVKGLAADIAQLCHLLADEVPDILLLDLHMPGAPAAATNVLDVVHDSDSSPIVILVTGDPNYALHAYEHAVSDYLVKPVRPARLDLALRRAEGALYARNHFPPGGGGGGAGKPLRWLTGARGRDVVLVDPCDVFYLQAERKYTIAFLENGQVLLRRGISDIEAALTAEHFFRIHRSTIVNIKYVECLRRDEMGRLRLHLRGRPERLIVSRSFEQAFKDV